MMALPSLLLFALLQLADAREVENRLVMLLDFDRWVRSRQGRSGRQAAGCRPGWQGGRHAGSNVLQLAQSLLCGWLPAHHPALTYQLRIPVCRFDLIKELLKNRLRIVWCTRLARAEVGGACCCPAAALPTSRSRAAQCCCVLTCHLPICVLSAGWRGAAAGGD
jgi:hypothetical protein